MKMPDISLPWNTDFSLTDSGDLVTCSDESLSTQRVIRRLLTAPAAYLWHPVYGAGIAAYVGLAVAASVITKAIKRQIFDESTVGRSPAPQVTVQQGQPGTGVMTPTVQYVIASSGGPAVLTFDVTDPNQLTGQ